YGIAIIPDELAGVGFAVRKPAQIPQRLRTRWHALEIERVLAPPNVQNVGRAIGGKGGLGQHHCHDGAEEQSLALHLMSPPLRFLKNLAPRPVALRSPKTFSKRIAVRLAWKPGYSVDGWRFQSLRSINISIARQCAVDSSDGMNCGRIK